MVGRKSDPFLWSRAGFRFADAKSDSHFFTLSGIRSLAFSAALPADVPTGLVTAAATIETTPTATAVKTVAAAAFACWGAQATVKSWATVGGDEGVGVMVGVTIKVKVVSASAIILYLVMSAVVSGSIQ